MSFQTQLPAWPTDTSLQYAWIERIKTLLAELEQSVADAEPLSVTLEQGTEPTQAEWEAAWLAASYTLPIPPTATLYWYNTATSVFGGAYGTIKNNSTIYLRDSRYSANSVYDFQSYVETDNFTANYLIGANLVNHPSFTLNLPIKSRLELMFSVTTQTTSALVYGFDFLLNGAKIGTTYYNLAADQGFGSFTPRGNCTGIVVTPDIDPGAYTLQAIFGALNSAGSPTSLTIDQQLAYVKVIAAGS